MARHQPHRVLRRINLVQNRSKIYKMKKNFSLNVIFVLSFIVGCTSNNHNTKQIKINCYDEKLRKLQFEPMYREVMSQFEDTFKIMKRDKRNFGASEVVSTKIDEAIFFNQNRTECLVIVLEKNDYGLVFGNAQIMQGRYNNNKWYFEPSIDYTYSKDYFEKYHENSFTNISKLARLSVLTDGEVEKDGCAIDDNYWFVELNR